MPGYPVPEQDLPVAVPAEEFSQAEPASRADTQSQAERHSQDGRSPWLAVFDWPWVALIPAVVTLVVMLYEITRPSFWQDEVSTLADTHRSLPQLFALLGHIDAVHGGYYVFMWFVTHVAGTSELAVRLPSAIAVAFAAGFIALLGKRLVSGPAGLAAGLVFAAIPQVSWYGQNARDYALVTAVATIATYLFVRAVQALPDAPRRTVNRWMIGYGVSLAVLGLLNLYALLLILAHGLMLAAQARRDASAATLSASGAEPARATVRLLVRNWLIAVVVTVVVSSPVLYYGWKERAQVAWIKKPNLHDLTGVEQLVGPGRVFAAALIIVAAGIGLSAYRGRARLRVDWPQPMVALCVSWLVLPPVLLLAVSVTHPVYLFRYIVFCIPAAALLVGTALVALGRVAGTVALILIVVLVVPAQATVRGPQSHGDNLLAVSQFLGAHAHRGDAVLFASFYERKIEVAYPAGFRRLQDISLGESAVAAAAPVALNAPTSVIDTRLATVSRVWLVGRLKAAEPAAPGQAPGSKPVVLPPLQKLGFRLESSRAISNYRVSLYVRSGA
jgi:mannosyltransferase